MRHYSCDGCGTAIQPDAGMRYVVQMDLALVPGSAALTEADLGPDAVEDMAELLAGTPLTEAEIPDRKSYTFDLCPGCARKFVRDPLGKEMQRKFMFSSN